jgi:hypothetical protein
MKRRGDVIRALLARLLGVRALGAALALVLAGCGAEPPEQPPVGVTPKGLPSRLAIMARDRWEAATGLRLEVGVNMAPLTYGADLDRGLLDCRSEEERAAGIEPHPCIGRTSIAHLPEYGQSWVQDMAIWRGAEGDDCRTMNVLLHEWGHALRLDAFVSHVTAGGLLMSASQDPSNPFCRQIDSESVEFVCDVAPCTRFQAERE